MLRTVIFDFDGLMVESERICYRTYREMLEEKGHAFSWKEYIDSFLGLSAVETFQKINAVFGIDFEPVSSAEVFHKREMQMVMETVVPLRPGLPELLDHLDREGYRKVIASSASPDRLLTILAVHGLDKRYDGITTAAEVSHGKPAPDIFLKACEKEGIQPSEALVLEDSQAGIEAAYRAGIPVFCIPCFKQPEEAYRAKAAAVLESLFQVPDAMQGLEA